MAEQQGAAMSDEDHDMYHAYAVRRRTQREIADEFGISQQAVSVRLANIRAKMPAPDLAAVRADLLAVYESTMREAFELAAREGAPVTAGKDGDIVRDPEDNSVVRDYALRLNALKLRNDTTAHLRKLLGLDAAEKLELTGTVRYELVGIDVEDLT